MKYLSDAEIQQKLASAFLWALVFNGVVFGFEYFYIYKSWNCSIILFSASVAGVILECSKKKLNRHYIFSHLLLLLVWYALTGLAIFSGGTLAASSWWYCILPLVASILISAKHAYYWSAISVVSVFFLYLCNHFNLYFVTLDEGELKDVHHFINQVGLIFTITIFGLIAEKARKRHLNEKEKMQEKAFFNKNLISLGEMAAGVAHEISNPLTIIKGNARSIKKELLASEKPFNKAIEHVDKIFSMIDRTAKIVDSLRVLSRDGSRDEMGLFKVHDAIDDVLDLCRDRLKLQNIKFELLGGEEMMQTLIRGIQVQLAQVLVNLINNAIDAISDLDEQWIKVEILKDDDCILFRVTDSGGGIPSALADQIFTPFFTTKRIGEGTGLGLSLCHQILKKMQGDIFIDHSVPNTCFVVKISLADEASIERSNSGNQIKRLKEEND